MTEQENKHIVNIDLRNAEEAVNKAALILFNAMFILPEGTDEIKLRWQEPGEGARTFELVVKETEVDAD